MKRRHVVAVVSELADAPEIPRERVVTADGYLDGGEWADRGATIVNLCRSYRYRAKGYYVSLLADARDQTVIPSVETLEGLSEPFGLFRSLQEVGVATVDLVEMRTRRANAEIAHALAYFGSCLDPRFRAAAQAVYREWPAPVLRLEFVREADEWLVAQVSPVPLQQLEPAERAPLFEALSNEKLVLRRGSRSPRELKRASIALLVDPDDPFSPSTPETLDRFERVASSMNVYVHRIGMDEIGKLGEYDALLIRALTGVREPAFQFALRAEALDMPVLDDTQSIIRCSNKVFLEELLRREGIPTPRTLVATSKTSWEQLCELGSPVVIKLPDSSFSAAVHKISTREEYQQRGAEMFRRSPLIIAQEYLPTEFDWRITVLDGRVLFAARYYMARGHWQIRSQDATGTRYGKVAAIARASAPAPIVELALRAAALIGNGLYGVDLKEGADGPVVIEINDNPNLDIGYDDAADGRIIYEDIINYFLRRVEEARTPEPANKDSVARTTAARSPGKPPKRHYRPFEVAGMELEYPVVDRDLNAVSLVEEGFRILSGRATSDVDLGAVAFSNEIADHVFEVKTPTPNRSLRAAEAALFDGVQRFSTTLREEFGARLLPTGMHPWMNPAKARLWSRSNARIYKAYSRLFDVQTHGWMNVHASHLNLPLGREREGVAIYNAAALLIPYLPALAASSPMYDGELQPAVDNRLAWILEHQARIPESCGSIVPEYVESFADYRKRILAPMYQALDRLPDADVLRHEFFNTRGAILRFSRQAIEIRVLDTQECVKLDVAIAVFVRTALRSLATRIIKGRIALPPQEVLVDDFRSTIQDGSRARVSAPHLSQDENRDGTGLVGVGEVLRGLLADARKVVRKDEADYLDLVEGMIDSGSLSEQIRARLMPFVNDEEAFTEAARHLYIELADCLEGNEPWTGRGLANPSTSA
ncbi:MAG TPA: glutamate-cysteine ligase family protein [Longimicrobiaceae bacterium]|nr:glutamate-cysteine ligase family protein [Longimicrobiaceae bacterium]